MIEREGSVVEKGKGERQRAAGRCHRCLSLAQTRSIRVCPGGRLADGRLFPGGGASMHPRLESPPTKTRVGRTPERCTRSLYPNSIRRRLRPPPGACAPVK